MPIAINNCKEFKIIMNFDKIHNYYYPHFEVEYENTTAKFAIDLSIMEMKNLPVNIANDVIDWAKNNQDELLRQWKGLVKKQIVKV